MGYENLFETFQKKGIDKVTINKFKNIPDITDFLGKDGTLTDANINKYNKALKKFRLDAFKGLNAKQLSTIESSGFLSQFAKDQRNKILKSGGNFNQKNLNKVLDQMFDFTFKDLDTAVGVKNPKIQDKKITKAIDKVNANKNIKPDQKLNIKYGLSQVDKLIKLGNTPAAKKLLTVILTIAPKGLFGMDLLIPTKMGSGELPKEGTPEYEQLMKDMGKNQGGMMDINFMTRPLGYKDGTRGGSTVGDLEKLLNESRKNVQKIIDENVSGQLNEKEMNMLTGPMASEKNTMANMGSIMTQEDLKGLKNLIDSEVYAGFMRQGDKRGPGDVDAFKIAKDFLVGKGIASDSPQFDTLINSMINLLNRDLIPQSQMELEKESRPGILNLLDKVLGGSKDQQMLEGFRKLRE
jgi:hypothetical protein